MSLFWWSIVVLPLQIFCELFNIVSAHPAVWRMDPHPSRKLNFFLDLVIQSKKILLLRTWRIESVGWSGCFFLRWYKTSWMDDRFCCQSENLLLCTRLTNVAIDSTYKSQIFVLISNLLHHRVRGKNVSKEAALCIFSPLLWTLSIYPWALCSIGED